MHKLRLTGKKEVLLNRIREHIEYELCNPIVISYFKILILNFCC